LPPTAALRAARRRLRRRLAPLRGAILLRAARAKYLYEYRKVALLPPPKFDVSRLAELV